MQRLPLLLISSLLTPVLASAQGTVPATAKPSRLDTSDLTVTYGDDRVAARLVQKQWDPSNPRPTCKLFHHIYAPDGALLTKGLGGQFEHHRGLFVGWNRTKHAGKSYDFWHCNRGERQQFAGTASPEQLGMQEGAQVIKARWVAPDGRGIVDELRGLAVVAHQPDHYVLHMRVECRALDGEVRLGGDPQHAGQQFRALQQFAEKDADPVLYLRPEGAKEHGNDVWTQCDWIAGILRLPDESYTVLRVESPNNRGKTTWSTRPYGRFGATRTVKLVEGKALRIDQLYVIAQGARDAKWCAEQATKWRDWVAPADNKHRDGSSPKRGG